MPSPTAWPCKFEQPVKTTPGQMKIVQSYSAIRVGTIGVAVAADRDRIKRPDHPAHQPVTGKIQRCIPLQHHRHLENSADRVRSSSCHGRESVAEILNDRRIDTRPEDVSALSDNQSLAATVARFEQPALATGARLRLFYSTINPWRHARGDFNRQRAPVENQPISGQAEWHPGSVSGVALNLATTFTGAGLSRLGNDIWTRAATIQAAARTFRSSSV